MASLLSVEWWGGGGGAGAGDNVLDPVPNSVIGSGTHTVTISHSWALSQERKTFVVSELLVVEGCVIGKIKHGQHTPPSPSLQIQR